MPILPPLGGGGAVPSPFGMIPALGGSMAPSAYTKLRIVLETYAVYRPDVGYVQGMS